jgi:Zn-dependent protease
MAQVPEVRVAGIPVRVEPAFFLIILLLGLPQPPPLLASWVAIATVSILLHEVGHAVAFRAHGLSPRIVLHGMGGLTTGEGALGPGARIVTSLAGPLAALVVLGLPALALAAADVVPAGAAEDVLGQVIWINIGWSVLNLVPVLPLDGGQVFLALCDLFTKGRGRRVAEVLSVVVAAAIGIWAYRQGFVFGAVLAGGLAALNLGQLRRVRHDELSDQLAHAQRALLGRDLDAADVALQAVARARPPADVVVWLRQLEGWRAVLAGDVATAEAKATTAAPAGATDSTALQAAVALTAGRLDQGAALAAWALAHDEARAPKGLLAEVVDGTGAAAPVAEELRFLGDEGRTAAALLRDLLIHLGHPGSAAEVGAAFR